MYSFPYFKESDPKVVWQFLQDHPFAVLTGSFLDGTQVATQIPLMVEMREDGWYVKGHIMRNTDHHRAFRENPNVLALFSGAHTYVSASWYSNPANGSTWNYSSVHLHGKVTFLNNEALIDMMKILTLHFEEQNQLSPTIYDNLPEDYRAQLLKAIVGIEIKVESVRQVFKLSQNRDEASYLNIIQQLEKKQEPGNAALVAAEMRKRKEQLFPPGQSWDASKFD